MPPLVHGNFVKVIEIRQFNIPVLRPKQISRALLSKNDFLVFMAPQNQTLIRLHTLYLFHVQNEVYELPSISC